MNFKKNKTRRKGSMLFLVVTSAVLLLLVTGCYNNNTGETNILGIADLKFPAFPETGSHAVVIFSEMHYSPAYDDQEGPTIGPPSDSVPVTGREIEYTAEEYTALRMSGKSTNSYDEGKAADIYRVNCSVCHGESLKVMDQLQNIYPGERPLQI